MRAAPHLPLESTTNVTKKIFQAVDVDDITTFGQSLKQLHNLNQAALIEAGVPLNQSPEAEAILAIMRNNGAIMCGQTLTGIGLFGLIEGAQASVDLRKKLRDHLGYFGGTVLATITDNRGAQTKTQNIALNQYAPKTMTP